MDERWLPVAGRPDYEVSDLGGVRSKRPANGLPRLSIKWRVLKQARYKHNGYLHVSLIGEDGKTHHHMSHRLVLEAFVGPCPLGMQSCHAPDPDRTNNRLENLRWGTPQENSDDKLIHGTHPSMVNAKFPGLTRTAGEGSILVVNEEVRRVRRLRREGWILEEIAQEVGCSYDRAKNICEGETWRNLDETGCVYWRFSTEKLITARRDRGLSRTNVQQLAGLSEAYYQRIETGYRPLWRVIRRLATALDVRPEDFCDLVPIEPMTKAALDRRGQLAQWRHTGGGAWAEG